MIRERGTNLTLKLSDDFIFTLLFNELNERREISFHVLKYENNLYEYKSATTCTSAKLSIYKAYFVDFIVNLERIVRKDLGRKFKRHFYMRTLCL